MPKHARRTEASRLGVRGLMPSKDQGISPCCPVRCKLDGAHWFATIPVEERCLRRSSYVRTRRRCLGKQLPGSSNYALVSWFAYRPAGMLVSEAGCACMAPAIASHATTAEYPSKPICCVPAAMHPAAPMTDAPTLLRDPIPALLHDPCRVVSMPMFHPWQSVGAGQGWVPCTQPFPVPQGCARISQCGPWIGQNTV